MAPIDQQFKLCSNYRKLVKLIKINIEYFIDLANKWIFQIGCWGEAYKLSHHHQSDIVRQCAYNLSKIHSIYLAFNFINFTSIHLQNIPLETHILRRRVPLKSKLLRGLSDFKIINKLFYVQLLIKKVELCRSIYIGSYFQYFSLPLKCNVINLISNWIFLKSMVLINCFLLLNTKNLIWSRLLFSLAVLLWTLNPWNKDNMTIRIIKINGFSIITSKLNHVWNFFKL